MAEPAKINIDESFLVEQCRHGDSAAMEHLILKYQNRIYNVIYKMCQNPDDAAELTQETFVKIIENINSFKGQSSFYTWAFRIAMNLTINHCKRSVKLGLVSLDQEFSDNSDTRPTLKNLLQADELDPGVIAAKKEMLALIYRALLKLDDQQRAVIVLRDIEGMNYEQITDVLDLKLGTVKSRLSRARSNLRNILEDILS